jgi:hypothetical protein
MTLYPPVPVPDGRILIDGQEHILGPKGEKLPMGAVKPQHVMEDQFVRDEVGHAIALSEQMSRFLAHFFANFGAYQELLAAQYDAKVGGPKGNVTLRTYDGKFAIRVQVADQISFGPELQVAKGLVDECLTDWTATAGDELKAIVGKAFSVDKAGQINRAALYSLLRLEFSDVRWKRAMEAIRDSMRVDGTKTYVRFFRYDGPDGREEPITIDLARA